MASWDSQNTIQGRRKTCLERRTEARGQAGPQAAAGLSIRFWLDGKRRMRDRAMFDLAIDSKLRGCDIVKRKIVDIVPGGRVRSRAIVVQQKAKRPVQFELLDHARGSPKAWLEGREGGADRLPVPSRIDHAKPIITRQYARLVKEWADGVGLRREDYGTHSLRRTKAAMIYEQTG